MRQVEIRMSILTDEGDRTFALRLSAQDVADQFAIGPHQLHGGLDQMRRRDARTARIEAIGSLLSLQIADWLNDKEGFNGERRADLIVRSHRQ